MDRLSGKAAQVVPLANARLNIWEGSIRSGKTWASLLVWLRYVWDHPGPHLLTGWSQDSLRRNIVTPLQEWLGPMVRHVPSRSQLFLGHREIWVVGSSTERSVDRIRGSTLRSVYADEISTMTLAYWRMITSRLSLPGACLFGTSNPEGPTHWLLQDYLSRARIWVRADGTVETLESELDLARFTFRLADNPALDDAYIAAISAEYTGVWRSRYIEGEWVTGQGTIWDAFDPAIHVADAPEWLPLAEPIIAIDYGTAHPFVALYGHILPATLSADGLGRIYIADEWVWDSTKEGRQLSDVQYSTRLRRWLGDRPCQYVYLDPSAASMYAQMRDDHWDGVRDAVNIVDDGLRWVATTMAQARLTIAPHCQALIAGTARYSWDEGSAIERPLKEADDEADALRYLVASTRYRWRPVLDMVAA